MYQRSTKCQVVKCGASALPGKSWCQTHSDLFTQIGKTPAVDAPPPRAPSLVAGFVGKPDPLPPAGQPAPAPDASTQRRKRGGRPKNPTPRAPEDARPPKEKRTRTITPVGTPATFTPPRLDPTSTYPELRYCGSCHALQPVFCFDTSRETPHGPKNFTCTRCEQLLASEPA